VSEKRFHNWLESARDWCISRGRFWGTPLPIWHSDDWEEIIVIGSIDELKKLTGRDDVSAFFLSLYTALFLFCFAFLRVLESICVIVEAN
jgi:isoleucyl-tRNA synthetase